MEIVRAYGLKIVTLSVALASDEHEKTRVNLRSLGTVPYASSLPPRVGFLIALLPAFQYRSPHEGRSRPDHGDL